MPRHRGFDQQDGDHLPSGVISPFGSGISQLVMFHDTGGYLRNFFQGQDSANSKAMNIILGPFLDVAGYSFAAASVLAPLSGFNIVTGFFKQMGNRNHTHMENCQSKNRVVVTTRLLARLFCHRQTCCFSPLTPLKMARL